MPEPKDTQLDHKLSSYWQTLVDVSGQDIRVHNNLLKQTNKNREKHHSDKKTTF